MIEGFIEKINEKINNNSSNKIISSNKNISLNRYNFGEEYKYFTKFREISLDERIEMSGKIKYKYSERVPIIVDCKDNINIDKNKYIVPKDLTMAQFIFIIKKRINVTQEQSVFFICNNSLLMNTETLESIYENNKEPDGFLYVVLSLENTYG